MSTISFVVEDEDGQPAPFALPMTAVAGRYDASKPLPEDDGDEERYRREQESFGEGAFDVYLHGNAAMVLCKKTQAEGSVKVVISSTKGMQMLAACPCYLRLTCVVDGVVLHFAPNGHSLNYRSCVIHGDTDIVTCPNEKRYAMHLLTNHMSRRRWSSTNEVAPEAMKKVQVIKVTIRTASAKIRATNLNGLEKAGFGDRDDVWTGVIPLYEVLGDPVHSGYFPARSVQKEVLEWQRGRNDQEKGYAERVAQEPDPKPAYKVLGEY